MNKKRLAAATAAAFLLIGGGTVAYAYWTTGGSGTGSATAGSTAVSDEIQLVQSGSTTGMYPGGPAVDINITAHNPAAFKQVVGEVTITPSYPAACPAANWTLVNDTDAGSFGAAGLLTPGQTSAAVKVGSIALNETGVNQDSCKSVVPTFAFASAAGA
jgi:hypothetical protein